MSTIDNKSLIQNLTQKMLAKKLYAIIWRNLGQPDLIKRDIALHLEYMIGLENRNVLFASGPFTQGTGVAAGDGLTIFRASSIEEARVFANSDPFVLSGARTYDVREWTVMEGSFQIRLSFCDQTYKFD